jgi:hypothetical protein
MKVTITITDNEEGAATVKVEFDPPAEIHAPNTTASALAAKLLETLREIAEEQDYDSRNED